MGLHVPRPSPPCSKSSQVRADVALVIGVKWFEGYYLPTGDIEHE